MNNTFFMAINKVDDFFQKKQGIILFLVVSIVLGTINIVTEFWLFSFLLFLFSCFLIALPSGKFGLPIILFFTFVSLLQTHFSLIGSYILFLFIVYYFSILIRQRKSLLKMIKDGMPLLIVYIVFAIYSLIISFTNIESLKVFSVFSFLVYCLFPIAVKYDLNSKKDFLTVATVALVAVLLNYVIGYPLMLMPWTRQAMANLSDATFEYYSQSIFSIRFPGLTQDQNQMGLLAFMPIAFFFIGLNFFKVENKKIKYSLIALAIIDALLAFTSGSKTYMLLVIFLAICCFVLFAIKNKKRLFVSLASISILCFILAIISIFCGQQLFPKLFIRFLGDGTSDDLLNTLTTGRLGLWKNYLTELISSPWRLLFGYGTRASYYFRLNELNVAHNLLINLLYDYGIIGTCLFAAYWIMSFYIKGFKSLRMTEKVIIFIPTFLFLFYGLGLVLTGSVEIFVIIVFQQILNVEMCKTKKIIETQENQALNKPIESESI